MMRKRKRREKQRVRGRRLSAGRGLERFEDRNERIFLVLSLGRGGPRNPDDDEETGDENLR